jgi:Zn-dependent peptidase ImmA (M78 family)/DNA-binding XRE family transcriptional regulator
VIFSGTRLRVARTFHGLTQRALAEKVVVSNGLIAAFENDAKQPGPEVLDALCAVLEVQPSYFDALHTDEFQEAESNFRKRITASEKMKRQVLARASMFGMVVDQLRQFGRFPRFDFPNLPAPSLAHVERIAEECREHWRLGIDAPIGDVARVAENAGAVILDIDIETAEKIDAFSRYGENSVIVLNTRKDSPSRTLFSLTHEIAHGVLHQSTRDMPLDRKEAEADHFAGAFLLPREAFTADYMANRALDWEGLLDLKRHWRVSIQAILFRAYQLQLIDAAEYRTRFRKLSYWGWRTDEPEEPKPDEPLLFRDALQRAYADYGKTPAALAKDLGWSRDMFEKATGVPVPDGAIARVLSLSDPRRMGSG